MTKPILYLAGSYPCLTETFIRNEVEGLERLGVPIEARGLSRLRPLDGLMALARSPLRALSLWRWLAPPRPARIAERATLWLRALQALPEAEGARHIHAHFLGYPATVARALARVVGVEYSLTAHAHDIHVAETHPAVVREAAFRVTCTETNRRHLRTRYPDCPFELVRHGIAVVETSPPPRSTGTPRILAVGRAVEKKGFAYLLEACALLRLEGLAAACTIVGEGPELDSLRALAQRLGIASTVFFAGALPHEQVTFLYAEVDVLVVPSVVAANGDRDGIPNVMLEAMARGVPVVATGAGAIPEVLQDGVTGLMVAPRDSGQLAAAIGRVLTDSALRMRIVDEARTRIRGEFAPDFWLATLRNLFDTALAEGGTARSS
ncbi:MAG: glycosyltransferase [FCB group bacterium]|jgi:glycosyltransferase involved in cell wall biosynthesis|nr:glycosyltransferase [FCB group bacterium]